MKTVRALLTRIRQDLRERWGWYCAQRRVALQRHWWDAYNS